LRRCAVAPLRRCAVAPLRRCAVAHSDYILYRTPDCQAFSLRLRGLFHKDSCGVFQKNRHSFSVFSNAFDECALSFFVISVGLSLESIFAKPFQKTPYPATKVFIAQLYETGVMCKCDENAGTRKRGSEHT
jgi:hypothetical protein